MNEVIKKILGSKLAAYWNWLLCIFSASAIITHFLLDYLLGHSLDKKLLITNLPFFLMIALGGIPLLLQISAKILKGNFGADIIALIALILAVYLQEFFTANLIILMLASGQALEEYASKKASFVLLALSKRMPNIAHFKQENSFIDVETDKLKIGDLVAIFPHETCPIDGEVVSGNGSMDESYLTGEPYRISKTIGSKVLSGAINGDSLFVIRVEKLAQNSRYAKIVEVIKQAEEQKPNLRRIADNVGAVFAPLALVIAGFSYLFTENMTNFLAVLTIATPCPLLIAVPIAIISAISKAAKSGIIVKDPKILERLPTCATAIFDKTGTLTCGEPSLSEIIALGSFSEIEILQKAASLERYSRHPLAGAIIKAASEKHILLLDAQNIAEKPGVGMSGTINQKEILITSRNKLEKIFENKFLVSKTESDSNETAMIKTQIHGKMNLSEFISKLPEPTFGLECLVIVDGEIAGCLRFRDQPRHDSHSFIGHLGPNHGFTKVILLSGDRDLEVNYLAKSLGIKECYSSQTPEQKLAFVKKETKAAPTLFMGDGINDAPALLAATVGIAFGQGDGITSESAGAVILESSLEKVDELIHISISMRKIVLQSAVGGMILSVIGMILACFGLISPATGAIAQQVIDFIAILNSLRLAFGKEIKSDFV